MLYTHKCCPGGNATKLMFISNFSYLFFLFSDGVRNKFVRNFALFDIVCNGSGFFVGSNQTELVWGFDWVAMFNGVWREKFYCSLFCYLFKFLHFKIYYKFKKTDLILKLKTLNFHINNEKKIELRKKSLQYTFFLQATISQFSVIFSNNQHENF